MGSACCSDNRTTIEKQVDEFICMLNVKPDTSRYAFTTTRQTQLTKAWANGIFGGTCFNPLGIYKGKRNRTNSLKQDIKTSHINQIYGGGYYILERV